LFNEGFPERTVLPVSVERVGNRGGRGESEFSNGRLTGGVMDQMPKVQMLNSSTIKVMPKAFI
jgi:hypothetical protein